ncbi:MAG: MBOAT family protein [Clostridia bacterium]|nr:MBOAT family protein [Clostridia bacterium]MBQ2092239.1 MBOAT family protein [Clostridia bacterium]MBQ3897443.1 MBOAT family protein [Clostridia bacterium]
MIFSSITFLFFFLVITLAVYYLLPRKFKNGWLLLTSLFFYGYGEPVYILLMVFSITVNYIVGLLMAKYEKKKKLFLIIGIIINLLLLGYFKYIGFFTGIINTFFSNVAVKTVALPIGISFYTFQIMSYLIDLYRGKCTVQKNIVMFGTYVTMFPQLIAGPIVRYRDIELQLENRKETFEMFSNGVRLFVIGLCKKVLIANNMGALFDALVAEGDASGVPGHIVAMLAFTFQIYFDFSGYSDMARGLGNMFGFSFLENFNYPYVSQSITEFWRRWHMSLSTWFKEYVYIPLGGNRKGAARQILNIMIVWALTGLWHGASWNFVLWGLYYGILLIIEKLFLKKVLERSPRFLRHIYAMVIVMLGWMLFQFTDMTELTAFFRGLFTGGFSVSNNAMYEIVTYIPLLVIAAFASLPVAKNLWTKHKDDKAMPYIETVLVIFALVLCTAALVTSTYNPFLYFRF